MDEHLDSLSLFFFLADNYFFGSSITALTPSCDILRIFYGAPIKGSWITSKNIAYKHMRSMGMSPSTMAAAVDMCGAKQQPHMPHDDMRKCLRRVVL